MYVTKALMMILFTCSFWISKQPSNPLLPCANDSFLNLCDENMLRTTYYKVEDEDNDDGVHEEEHAC